MEKGKTKKLKAVVSLPKKDEEDVKEEHAEKQAISAESGTMIEASSRYQKYLGLTRKKIVVDKS